LFTVYLPVAVGTIELVGDLRVRAGEALRIEAGTLILGPARIHVAREAALELMQVRLSDSNATSGIANEGNLTAVNCSFVRLRSKTTGLLRYGAAVIIEGSAEQPPIRGALLAAFGGAVLSAWNRALFVASGCIFEDNQASSAAQVNWGGAVANMGGTIVFEAGTVFRGNRAAAGLLAARGGAVYSMMGSVRISKTLFVGNQISARNDEAKGVSVQVRGGALDAILSDVTISSSRFEANSVYGGGTQSSAGAIHVGDGTTLRLDQSEFVGNQALWSGQLTVGGAIRVENGGSLFVSNSLFEKNVALGPSESFGGAIDSQGAVVLYSKNIVRRNRASGEVATGGGGVSLRLGTATSDNTKLIGNSVQPAVVSPFPPLGCAAFA
jgi:hypothetical protein